MSPFKVVEKYELKKDLVTYLQNSVREPKLQYEDMKVKLFVCRGSSSESRRHRGVRPDAVISALREPRGFQDGGTAPVAGVAGGTVRTVVMADGTLREIA